MLDWFKTNLGKFQFMLLGVKNVAPFRLNVNGKIIPCSNEVKLLAITTDNELKFKKHIEYLINYMLSAAFIHSMHSLIASLSMPL